MGGVWSRNAKCILVSFSGRLFGLVWLGCEVLEPALVSALVRKKKKAFTKVCFCATKRQSGAALAARSAVPLENICELCPVLRQRRTF